MSCEKSQPALRGSDARDWLGSDLVSRRLAQEDSGARQRLKLPVQGSWGHSSQARDLPHVQAVVGSQQQEPEHLPPIAAKQQVHELLAHIPPVLKYASIVAILRTARQQDLGAIARQVKNAGARNAGHAATFAAAPHSNESNNGPGCGESPCRGCSTPSVTSRQHALEIALPTPPSRSRRCPAPCRTA